MNRYHLWNGSGFLFGRINAKAGHFGLNPPNANSTKGYNLDELVKKYYKL